ncbi:MAG: ATP-dependent DNA helicase RecQ, partial [Sphingomonadales bacterium]
GERARLTALGALVETAGCRRRILLRHFGESDAPEICGNCDNCLNPPAAVDASVVAQKFLSAVFRTGMMFGVGYIESILLGASTERSLMNGHEKLSVFGIVEGEEAALIKPVARALLLRDALRANAHGGLEFGPAAKAIMKGEESLSLVLPPKRERKGRRGKAGGAANPVGEPLFEALRARRRELAMEAQVPPYVIFHDSVLRDMASEKPGSLDALGRISGIGSRKLEAYGDAFLQVIREAA